MATPSFLTKHNISQAFLLMISKALMAAALLAGCIRPAHKDLSAQSLDDQEESLSTFSLKEATATVAPQDLDDNYKVVTSTKLTVKLCLQDKRTLEAVIGHTFRVEGGDAPQDLKANISGCLVWTESFSDNPFATQTFISQERKIIATGVHSGHRTFRFAYNPWAAPNPYFADLNFQPGWLSARDLVSVEESKDALAGITKDGQKTKLPVWPESFSFQALDIEASNKARKLKLHGEFIPNVYLTYTYGAATARPLTDGLFEYHMYFVIETKPGAADATQNKKFIAYEVHSKKPVKMDNLKLKFDEVVELANQSNQGELRLAVQIIPVKAPESLIPFHGVYTLGESGTLNGSFSPKLIDTMNNVSQKFDISSYLNGAYRQDGYKIKTDQTSMSLVQTTSAEIQSLNLTSIHSMSVPQSDAGFSITTDMQAQNDTQQFTDRDLTFKACIQNASGAPVIGQSFQVQTFLGGEPKSLKTTIENQGCLSWTETFKNISYYAQEIPKEGFVTITNGDSVMKIPVAVDPLGSPAFYDLRQANKKQEFDNLVANLKTRKVTLLLKQFSLTPRGDQLFAIDKSLNLDTSQTFNFDLPGIQVHRTDRPAGKQNEDIRDGYYLVRVAVQKDYIDHLETENCQTKHILKDGTSDGCEKQHVATSQKVVHVLGGKVQGTIMNLFFTDWRFLRVINNLLVEFYPIDYSKLSPQNLDEQMQNLNLEFADASKSPAAIAKFDSLIDKNSAIYSKDNFIGQVIPLENTVYDQNLYLNNEERKLAICEMKQCGSGFQSGVQYDTTDSDPEIAKFRLGNIHLIGVKVKDLMPVEKALVDDLNLHNSQTFDLGQFAQNNFSDLLLLKTTSLETELSGSINKVLPVPKKGSTNVQAFVNVLNKYAPDYNKWMYNCDRKNLTSDVACFADTGGTGIQTRVKEVPQNIMVQDRLPNLDNYLPKLTVESLSNFVRYTKYEDARSNEAVDASIARNHAQMNDQRNLAYRLCYFWFKEYLPRQNKTFTQLYQPSTWLLRHVVQKSEWLSSKYDKWMPNALKVISQDELADDLVNTCVIETYKDPDSTFAFEKKLKVYDFKQSEDTQSLDTFGIDISSGESVAAGISDSKSTSSTWSFNPVAFLGLVKSLGKFISVFSPLSYSWSSTDTRSLSAATTNSNTSTSDVVLDVEQENMRLNLLDYDSCVTIRLTPAFIAEAELLDRVGPRFVSANTATKSEKMKLLTRGLLICNGEREKTPLMYTEKYYFVRQALNDRTVTRLYDFRNNPYSFKLRGDNELQTFFALTQAKSNSIETARVSKGHNLKANVEERMQNLTGKNQSIPYRQPSFPGVISLD